MKHWLLALSAFSLTGCSAYFTAPSDHVAIDSIPSGAEVQVMGEVKGKTPMQLPTKAVFPVTYAPELQPLYGRVRLIHPGCVPYETTVSTASLENGIKARLQCDNAPAAPTETTTAPRSARERLLELEALRKEGLLDEAEYQRARQRIIDTL